MRLIEIFHSYRPYDQLPEFSEGFRAYNAGQFTNPYDRSGRGVAARAWDRGLEAASRWQREKLKQEGFETLDYSSVGARRKRS
jgi:hypothetical protein